MASLALTSMAQYGLAAGPGGMFIAGLAGAILDAYVINPMLFPPDPIESGKMGDVRIQGVEEGSPGYKAYGVRAKFPATLAFASAVIEEAQGSSVGKGQAVVNYQYYSDCVLAGCDSLITKLLRVWADGKIVFDDSIPTILLEHADLQFIHPYASGNSLIFIPDTAGINLKTYGFLDNVNVIWNSGITEATNGEWEARQVRETITVVTGAWPSLTVQVGSGILLPGAGQVNSTPTGAATPYVSQTPPLWSQIMKGATPPYIRLGSTVESVIGAIENEFGVGNSYGMRGTMSMTIINLKLSRFGGRVPNFEFMAELAGNPAVDQVVASILDDAGLSGKYTVTDIAGLGDVEGYTVRTPSALKAMLEPLMLAYGIVCRERNGLLHFYLDTARDARVVAEADLGASDSGSKSKIRVVTPSVTTEQPGVVNLTYPNPDNLFKEATAVSHVAENTSQTRLNVTMPVALTSVQAHTLSNKILWHAIVENEQVYLDLPPSYADIEEGDELTFTLDGDAWSVIAVKVTVGNNYLVRVEGVTNKLDGVNFVYPGS